MTTPKELSAKFLKLAQGNRNLADAATVDTLVTFFEGQATAYEHAAEVVMEAKRGR